MTGAEGKDVQHFSKIGAALWQLERAIALFLDEADYACAITLAGAAEEILGKLLNGEDKTNALQQFVDLCIFVSASVAKDKGGAPSGRMFVTMANAQRDDLKHITDGSDVTLMRQDAVGLLDRAIENFMSLTGKDSSLILRYMDEVRR